MGITGEAPSWVEAGGGYQLALQSGKLVCRNPKGTVLKSVPKQVRETDTAADLVALRDWLARHDAQCKATVEAWMVGSFEVPAPMIAAVWRDPAWAAALLNLVVQAGEHTGLLRGVDDAGRVGIVDLDGETHWLDAPALRIAHPIDIADLADFQELLAELGEAQQTPQLSREVFRKPEQLDSTATAVNDYSEGVFDQLRYATSRAQNSGCGVRGGYATCPVFDAGRELQARYWIGSDAPDAQTWTGDLIWVDANETPMPLVEVGPVAYSEGVRMAAAIYAGRKVEENQDHD